MNDYLVLRDTRLAGYPSRLSGMLATITVDKNIPLSTAFLRINSYANAVGKLRALYILCHGYGTGPDDDLLWRGGLGLQLGKEGLDTSNVSKWSAIKNSVAMIVVHSCGAAYSGPSIMSPLVQGNGQTLMSSLSNRTNSIVYAADTLQWYTPAGLDFGGWEGNVYMFMPSGVTLPGFYPTSDNVW